MTRPPTAQRRRRYVPRDPAVTSAIMSAIRGRDNRAEVALRKALWRLGYRYRLYDSRLPGRPDMVFRSRNAVIFVDGDFWHGRTLIELGPKALRSTLRTERRAFWIKKIRRNVQRDAAATDALRALGWRVLRVWEKDVVLSQKRVVARAARFLR